MTFGLLVVVIIIVVAVVSARGRGVPMGADDGPGALRGVFVYSLSLLGVSLVASGISSLLRVLLEPTIGTDLVGGGSRSLAFGLSLTIVGAPVWALTWRAAQRNAAGSPEEQRSLSRRLYLGVLRAVALAVAVPSAIEAVTGVVGVDSPDAGAIARALVWTVVWASHERVAGREVPFGSDHTDRVDRIEVYVVAASTLGLLGAAVGTILDHGLSVLYELTTGVGSLVRTSAVTDPLVASGVAAVVGGLAWWWHWGVVARGDAGTRAWRSYLFLVGILSGTATAIVSGSILLHRMLAWTVGAATQPAGVHFDEVPAALAGIVVGLAVWGHHRAVLREVSTVDRGGGAERAYRYLLVAAGMLTAAGGTTTVLMIGVDLAVPGRTVVTAPGGVRDALAVGLTLLLIGVPVWWRSWSWAERQVRDHPTERHSLARRTLIFGAFGLATVATVIAASILLYELFDALLAGGLAVALIEEQRWAIAVLLTAGAVSVHYGLVLREDRAAAPATVPTTGVRDLVVVAAGAAALREALRARTDVHVRAWERADATATDPPDDLVDAILERMEGVRSRRLLVVVGPDGRFEMVPLGTA